MDKAAQRQIERAVYRLVEQRRDRCSLCNTLFPHASTIYYGAARGGVAVVSGCCYAQLQHLVGFGLYLAQDTAATDLARRAGRQPAGHNEEGSWKTGDGEWFKDHPTRSHRLRACLPGEDVNIGLPPSPHHRVCVLVRQVEPGKHVSLPIFFDEPEIIPDIEPFLHALFDMACAPERQTPGTPLTLHDVAVLAATYAEAFQ